MSDHLPVRCDTSGRYVETADIAIVGGRRRTDRETVDRLVARLPADTVIVSGGACGPDTWAEEAARNRGLATKIFRPHLDDVDTLSQGQITRRRWAFARRCFNEAEAHAPRMRGAASPPSHEDPGFNEAEAHAPRMRSWFFP
jgi:YspA, cpYpsA-related SLOG family